MMKMKRMGAAGIPSMKNTDMKMGQKRFCRQMLAGLIGMLLCFLAGREVFGAGGDIQWQYRDSQAGKQVATAAAVDPFSGEVVITGYTVGASDDYYTVKINAAGSGLAWTAPAVDPAGGEDRAMAVVIDHEGNVVVTGHVKSANNIDFHTVKYDGVTGAVLWAKTYNGVTNDDDYATAMTVDLQNNVYVGGFTPGTSGHDDFLVVKYSPAGALMWARTYNNATQDEHDRVTAIAAGLDGVAVTGGSMKAPAASDWDILTVKYDFNGTELWSMVKDGGSGDDDGVAVALDSSGAVIVTGYLRNGAGNDDIYTVKYDGSDGSIVAGMEMTYADANGGDDRPRGLAVDDIGDIYITGYTVTVTGLYDYLTARYSGTDGTPAWGGAAGAVYYGSGGNNTDIPTSLAVNNVSVLVTGYTHKDVAGDDDFTTVKYKKDNGHQLWPATYNNAAVNKDEQPVFVGLDNSGRVYVAGWSDKSATAALDYDYYAIRYDPGALNTPTNLNAVVVDENTIDLSWDDNSSSPNESEYRIERKVGVDGTYAEIDTVGQDVNTYRDDDNGAGLTPHTKYYYRVRGYNTTLEEYSHYSVEASAKTTIVTYNYNPAWVFRYDGPDQSDDLAQDISAGPDLNPVVTGYSTIAAGFDYYTVKLQRQLVASDADSVSLDLNGDNLADIRADFTATLGADATVVINTTLGGGVSAGTHTGAAAGNTTLVIIDVPQGNEARINRNATGITLSWNNIAATWTLTANGGYANAAILDRYVGQVWDDSYDDPGNGEDMAHCVEVNSSNEVVVSGNSYLFTAGFGSSNDIYTREYPADGPPAFGDPFNWEDQYNGTGGGDDYAVAIDEARDGSDNLAIVGYGRNAFGDNDIYVLYFQADGTRLWSDIYNPDDGDDRPTAVTFDPDGDVIVTGRVTVGGDYDIVTTKYCADGTSPACIAGGKAAGAVFWTVTHDSGSGADESSSVATDSSGDVYVAGFVANGTNKDNYIVKLAGADGSEVWGAPVIENGPGNGDDQIVAMAMDTNDDEFTVAGTWSLAGNSEFRVTRYTAAGTVVWDRIFDEPASDDRVQAMGMDPSGNVCVAGVMDHGTSTDLLAVKYDYSGEILGTTVYDGGELPAKDDEAAAVAVNRYGEAFVAGTSTTPDDSRDYLVMLCEGDVLQAPAPFTATPYYTTIDFTWENNAPAADAFMLEGKIGACPIIETDTIWQHPFGIGTTNFSETGLAIGQTYCFRIKDSVTATGNDSRWLEREVTTIRPPAPASLTANNVTTTRVQLNWTDNVNAEESFLVQRCADTAANCGTADGNFSFLDTIPAARESYDDPTACAGQIYTYRVRAVNALWGEEPEWSYVQATPAASDAPVLSSVSQVSEGRLDLVWTDTNTDETGFNIYRCQGAGCTIDVATDTPVKAVNSPADSLVSLKMDETVWTPGNPEVLDSSGNANHGTAYGDTQRGVFDGNDDYISLGDLDALDAPASFTVEVWFRRDADNASATNHGINNVLVAQSSAATNDNLEIGTQGTAIELYLDTAGNVNETKTVELGLAIEAGIQDHVWYHLVFTYDRDAADTYEAKLYLDGALLAQWNDPAGLLSDSSTSPFTIGMARPDGEAVTPTGLWGDFTGEIDEVTIYNRALTGAEVTAYHANGNIPLAYADSILDKNTTYRYQVTTFKTTPTTCGSEPGWESSVSGYGQNATTAVLKPVLLSAAPDAVEETTDINLSWTDNTEFEEKFVVERCDAASWTCGGIPSTTFDVAANPGMGGTVNWTDDTACEGTYTYRVRAVRTTAPVWDSGTSVAELAATTAARSVPVMVSATKVNEEEIELAWTDTTRDETGFTVERCINGASCRPVAAPASPGTGGVTFVDIRLAPNTVSYDYRVRADKAAGICSWQTGWSALQVSANTNIGTPIVVNPTFPNTTQIDLSWNDPTSRETGFVIERCDGDCTGGFTVDKTFTVNAGVTAISDLEVCESQTYTYRVRAIDQDFAGGMNGCWTKRQKLSISPFVPDTVIRFTVNHINGEMQNDFDDLRFYSFTDATEVDGEVLQYWIDREIDNTSIDIWLRTPASGDNIYMYYGNPEAVRADTSGYGVFDYFDDFQGTTINTAKWQENDDAQNEIFQNDGLYLDYKDNSWLSLIGKSTFNRSDEPVLYIRWTPLAGSSWYGGWETDQTSSVSTAGFAHSFGTNGNYINYTYELNVNRGRDYLRYYDYGYQYDSKVEVDKDGGARSYLRGGFNHTNASYKHLDWDLVKDTTVLTAPDLVTSNPLRIGILQYQSDTLIHSIGVLFNPPSQPTVNFTADPDPSCNALPHIWESANSTLITPAAATALEPTLFAAEALSESEIKLTWNDVTPDDDGFTLERCQGNDADCVAVTAPNFDWLVTLPEPEAPVVSFAMDEASWPNSANDVQDGSGNANHGRSYNGANIVNDGTRGRVGNFDGSNDYILINNSATLQDVTDSSFTYEAWVKPSNVPPGANANPPANDWQYAIISRPGQHTALSYTKDQRYQFEIWNDAVQWQGFASTDTFAPGQWHHVVGTVDSNLKKAYLYVDGRLQGSRTYTGNLRDYGTTAYYVGVANPSTSYTWYFKGQIDDVAIHNRALSVNEITWHAGLKEYIDSGLSLSTEYTYRLRAFKNSSFCTWDTGDAVRITASTLAPPKPTNQWAAKVNTTQINLGWDDNTSSNTIFTIERSSWNGSSWDAPDFIGPAGANDLSFSDTGVCNNTLYRYRVRAAKEAFVVGGTGLSGDGGDTWSRRAPVQITGFQPNAVTEIAVPYDPDMQGDFDDLRFFDETAGQELKHYIISRVVGNKAYVLFKTGANDNINMYYGNLNATDISDGPAIFDFYDDFQGTVIDAAKWLENDVNNKITQNDGLDLAYVNTIWNAALFSQQTFSRTPGKTVLMQVNVQNGSGSDYFAFGWGLDQTATLSYTQLRHGFIWWNFGMLRTYNPWYNGAAYTASDYLLKIELKAAGAKYYVQGGAYSDLTLFNENANYSESPLRLQLAQQSQQARIGLIAVYDRSATATSGTEERGLVADGWETDYAEATASTDAMVTPTLNSVTRISESRIDLAWTDTNGDETGFELERCLGASCTTIQIGPGQASYSDTGVLAGNTYCYRILAKKTGPTCGWQTPYHPLLPGDAICAVTTLVAPVLPPTVGATTNAANTTQVVLQWTDNSEAESGFRIWRCDPPSDCSSAANFNNNIHTAGPNQTSWNDNSVCSGQVYSYKVEAVSDGLPVAGFANSGGGSWTRRRHLTFDAFVPDSLVLAGISYDADMQADFDDLRVVDESTGSELPFTIESKTNGVAAQVWIRTGNNDAINLYYGNNAATAASAPIYSLVTASSAEFYDDFQGTGIDAAKWVEIDSKNKITQNNGLQLGYVDNIWDAALISQQTFSRAVGKILLFKVNVQDGPGSDYFALGWARDQTASATYNGNIRNGYYWNNFGQLYTILSPWYNGGAYSATDYLLKIELKATGAKYFIKGGAFSDWQLFNEDTGYSDASLRLQIAQQSHQARIDLVAVYRSASTVAVGAEEVTSFEVWTSSRSSADDATTAVSTKPNMNQLNTIGLTETSIQVAWTDVNPDESYFRIYRGASDCTGFTEIGQTAGPDIFFFTDTGADLPGGKLAYSTTYCYQVQAHKDTAGGCDWDSGFDNTATAATDIPRPGNIIATATETARVELVWDDTTTSETAFLIERCDGNLAWCEADPDNRYGSLASVGAGIDYYTDTTVCPNGSYSYRVLATRSGEWTTLPGDADDAATGGPPVDPAALALTEVYDQDVDQRQIDLIWTDANPDETGFKIERCNQTVDLDCDTADTHFSVIRTLLNHDGFNSGIDLLTWEGGGKLGSAAWDFTMPVASSDGIGSVKVYGGSGTAVLESTSDGGDANWNQTRLRLTDPASLGSGDLDVQFDWVLPTVVMPESTDQYHVHVRLQLNAGVDVVYLERSVNKTDGSYYWGRISLNGANYDQLIQITDTKGRFRVTRIGGTYTMYYWDWVAKDWQVLRSQAGADAGSVPSMVAVRQYAQRNEGGIALKAVIDNFRINSGLITAYSDTNSLADSTEYYYRVRSFKDSVCPAWNGLYTLKGNELTNPAATTLTAAPDGSLKIKLTWPDNASDEDGYEIEKQVFGGVFVKIADLDPDAIEYIDNRALEPDTTYSYRVRSHRDNYASYSAYSNVASAKTDQYGEPSGDDTTCPPAGP